MYQRCFEAVLPIHLVLKKLNQQKARNSQKVWICKINN